MIDSGEADIVLIEDNEDDIAIALRALQRHQLHDRVRVLRDGRQALDYFRELVREHHTARSRPLPRAVFLDLRLPRVEGRRVLQALRDDSTTRDLPVVILSSTRQDAEVEECYRLGANSFVPKQYGEGPPGEYLVQAVRYWLELNRSAGDTR